MTRAAQSYRRLRLIGVLSVLALLAMPALAFAQGPPVTVLKLRPSGRVVTPPLSSLPQAPWARAPQDLKVIPAPGRGGARLPAPGQPRPSDSALQTKAGPHLLIEPKASFTGLGENGAIPPDPNIAVGPTDVVQTVNTEIGIFDRTSGALVSGYPKKLSSLWAGLNGCGTDNAGDPVVQYDRLAQRWLITQIGTLPSSPPYSECIAVSTGSDPTGSYYAYSYSFGSNDFNDYPKFGVWPTKTNSAYAASFNIFTFYGLFFAGNYICVFDRKALLAGASAWELCAGIPYDNVHFYSFLPSDLDGATPPPDGSPAYFLTLGTSSSLRLYGLKPDFTTDPNNPTFTLSGPFDIPVDPYTQTCGDGASCVPQPDTTQLLASLGDRLMYQLAYRNFGGGHEAMVVNHSVATASGIGVRWYELDSTGNPSQPFALHQQGTFAGSPPDSAYRWMGSAAMDAAGDIALGYSESSSSIYPEIAFTGRLAGDPINTMGSETVLQPGNGSQTGYERWGDYTALRIDPSDDMTFWYTNEYYKATASYQWSTYIGSFTLASGSPSPPPPPPPPATGVSVSLDPSTLTLSRKAAPHGTVAVSVTASSNASVTLSASGLPSNATATFSTNPVSGSGTSYLDITVGPHGNTGNFSVMTTATDQTNDQGSATLNLTVTR